MPLSAPMHFTGILDATTGKELVLLPMGAQVSMAFVLLREADGVEV